MDRDKHTVEKFLSDWSKEFPDYALKLGDLKEPHALMGALLQLFDRLGIDSTVLAESPEEYVNDSMVYYRDLLCVINMTRVVNHLVSVLPQATINMTSFLQPTVSKSHSMLLFLFNLMIFNEEKLIEIAPSEEKLFSVSDNVNKCMEVKNNLKEMLNQQAQEKALRAEMLEKVAHNIRQLEEELKEETAALNAEQQVAAEVAKEHRQSEVLLDQKKALRDTVQAEVEKKKSLMVYDADDVKAQVEQATRDVQELEEKANAARATLIQKEESLRNLQTLKPILDAANNQLREITKLSETLMDTECGDLESESQEGELAVLQTELGELQAADRELQAARAELQQRAREGAARRAHDNTTATNALREALEKCRRNLARCEQGTRRAAELQRRTRQYEEQRVRGLRTIADIHDNLHNQLESTQEMLMNQMVELAKQVEKKQRNSPL